MQTRLMAIMPILLTLLTTSCVDQSPRVNGTQQQIRAEAQTRLDQSKWFVPDWYKRTISINIKMDNYYIDKNGNETALCGWGGAGCRVVQSGAYSYFHQAPFYALIITNIIAIMLALFGRMVDDTDRAAFVPGINFLIFIIFWLFHWLWGAFFPSKFIPDLFIVFVEYSIYGLLLALALVGEASDRLLGDVRVRKASKPSAVPPRGPAPPPSATSKPATAELIKDHIRQIEQAVNNLYFASPEDRPRKTAHVYALIHRLVSIVGTGPHKIRGIPRADHANLAKILNSAIELGINQAEPSVVTLRNVLLHSK